EVRHLAVDFRRVRNSIPTQAEVEGQTPGGSPVILNISKPGNTVPVSVVFEGSFAVAAGEAKQEIGKIVAGEIPVEPEVALGGCLQWLQLAEVQPSAAELPLMSSPRPGQVIANLRSEERRVGKDCRSRW